MAKLGKPFNYLGDTPGEFGANLLILIIVGPLYLFLMLLTLLWGVVGMILRFPSPRGIPGVVTDDALPPKQIFDIYSKKFDEVLTDVTKTTGENEVVLASAMGKVFLSYDDDTVYIGIDGLDTGYWHTLEEENIDIYFWASVAVLRNGLVYKKSRWGRKEGWFYSDEMKIWMGVSTGGVKHSYSYHKYARKL